MRKVQGVQRVPGAHAGLGVEAQRKLGVEACVAIGRAVVPLAKVDQAGIGEDFFGVERFAPARVGQDDVGHKALGFEFEQHTRHRLAVQHGPFHLPKVGVLVFARGAVQVVRHPAHLVHAGRRAAAQAQHLPVGLLGP